MMMSAENPVQLPVLEDNIMSPAEIHELLSLFLEPAIHSASSSETNRSSPSVYSTEERKRRRMISNRESARRSRWRKKQLYEDLTNEVNRLNLVNRELKNRLGLLTHDCYSVQRDSNRILSESIYLQHKLRGLQQILAHHL
ncbi:hypothetical protein ACS0TY_023698 [Phlomoides rotata]